MSASSSRFRIATYNIHKCRGLDMKFAPERIIGVLRELDADVLCLQEVVDIPDGTDGERQLPSQVSSHSFDQAGEIARAFPEYNSAFGTTRPFRNGMYGNMTLSRLHLAAWRNYDVTRRGRERRGVLETEVDAGNGTTLHVYNVHLGTGHMERRFQARRLVDGHILTHPELKGPRVITGDFNEWTRGLTTRLLRERFQTFRPRLDRGYPRTYPGVLPVLSLDHCYYEPPLRLESACLWRTRTALVASDHLPLITEFSIDDSHA
jgi:endonuclease/exonuclease/phosphatase family metal-dependent hydrolase